MPVVARRTDSKTGIREAAQFFGSPTPMLGISHLPETQPRLGVVVCPSIYMERVKTYRAELDLGRALARRGMAVQRFHYRGFEQSAGEARDVSFDGMCADAAEAAELLRTTTGVERIVVMGIRWGAMMAARLVSDRAGVPLILWDPVLRTAEFFREAFIAHSIASMNTPVVDGGTRRTPMEELRTGEVADLLGFELGRRLYETAQGQELGHLLGEAARRVLVLHLGGTDAVNTERADLVERWRQSGMDIDAEGLMSTSEAWWFLSYLSDLFKADALVDKTVAWIETHGEEAPPWQS